MSQQEMLDGVVSQLRLLREAVDRILVEMSAEDPRRWHGEPVNWADLRCIEARQIVSDSGMVHREVLIEEASPDAIRFKSAVTKRLWDLGWSAVFVVTQW